jgi:hypothetical protein
MRFVLLLRKLRRDAIGRSVDPIMRRSALFSPHCEIVIDFIVIDFIEHTLAAGAQTC